MMIDTDIISAPGTEYQVLGECCHTCFKDGTTIGVHLVTFGGLQQMFIRAVRLGDYRFVIFDLRNVCPPLGEEIPSHHWHDTDGLVKWQLRFAYPSKHEALAAMVAHPLDVLTAVVAQGRAVSA